MNIIFLLIGVSLTVAVLFLCGFLWSVRSGQYEDEYTPSVRMLFDNKIEGKNHPEGSKEDNQSNKQIKI